MENAEYLVYLLINTKNNCTYIGSTNNSIRRLRQHNGEIVGGAKYTKLKKEDGQWIYYAQIIKLNKHNALSIEKKIQKRTRKSTGKTTLDKRLNCISKILEEYELIKMDLEFIIINNVV
jgi:predicted GIY-YIG superfamily endonuclease